MFRNKPTLKITILLGLIAVAISMVSTNTALSKGPAAVSPSEVIWTWGDPVGTTSELVRTDSGISADYDTSGLAPNHAMTLWFIVFNYPELCAAGSYQCGIEDLGKDRLAQGDFLLASGHVIGPDGTETFGGHLKVGDISGSGLAEFAGGCLPGLPGCGGPVGVVNPGGALVVLAIHSHGPKSTSAELKAQISSYLGGCDVVIGSLPGGFAANAGEVPVNDGECSTIQISPHAP